MAQINLLPWRERMREERKREFISILVGFIIIAGGLVFLVDRYFNGEIDSQVARNQFMRAEIAVLDEQVAEITQLRQQKNDIQARINVITDLQGTRSIIVRIFDELVKTLPDGVYYNSLVRTGDTIAIEGVAESYARITTLMRQLDESDWFLDPDLDNISATELPDNPMADAFAFSLSLTLELPTPQDEV